MKTITFYIFISLFLLTYSCALFRHTEKGKEQIVQPSSDIAFIDSFKRNYFDFKTLKIKFDAEYSSKNESMNFSGSLQIKKDSLIWISLSPGLGIEAFRMQLTDDSLKYVNRLSSEYFAGDYDLINKQYQIQLTFNDIQAILINVPVVDDEFQLNDNITSPNIQESDSLSYIKMFSQKDSLKQILWVSKQFIKIVKEELRYVGGKGTNIFYSDFNKVGKYYFPHTLDLTLPESTNEFKIKINFTDIVLNGALKTPFKISAKYQPILFKQK